MRWFMDCEFAEDGRVINLISIALVAEDGRSYYAVSTEFDPAACNDWVKANVLPKLPPHGNPTWKTRARIAQDILELMLADPRPQIWAYYADYDWVALCQLYGPMASLPRAFGQQWCWDLKQHMETLGVPRNKRPLQTDEHDALADARWVRKAFLTVQALHPDVVPGRAAPVMVERVIEEHQNRPVEADAATPLDAAQWLLGMHNGNPLARDAAPRPPHTDLDPVKCACESCTSCRALAMADPAQWLANDVLRAQFGAGVEKLAQSLGLQVRGLALDKARCTCGRALDAAMPPRMRFPSETCGHAIGCPEAAMECSTGATHEGPALLAAPSGSGQPA